MSFLAKRCKRKKSNRPANQLHVAEYQIGVVLMKIWLKRFFFFMKEWHALFLTKTESNRAVTGDTPLKTTLFVADKLWSSGSLVVF